MNLDLPRLRARYLALLTELGRLKGWEPDWRWQMMQVDGAWVASEHVVTTGSTRATRTETWAQHSGNVRGQERTQEGEEHAWLIAGGRMWHRWGDGPWTVSPHPNHPALLGHGDAPGLLVEAAWDASLQVVAERPWHHQSYRFTRHQGQGTLELVAEGPEGPVTRIQARDILGRLEWDERRTFTIQRGLVLLGSRQRTYSDGRVETEDCRWMTGPHAVSETMFTPPTP